MKKTLKKTTLQMLDKKIDTLGQTLDKKIDALVTTVDSLAIATKRGFDNTVSKTEFTEFKEEMLDFKRDMTDFKKKAEMTFFNLDSHARTTNERLDAIEKILGPLVQISSFMQKEIRELNSRVIKLEHHAGIK